MAFICLEHWVNCVTKLSNLLASPSCFQMSYYSTHLVGALVPSNTRKKGRLDKTRLRLTEHEFLTNRTIVSYSANSLFTRNRNNSQSPNIPTLLACSSPRLQPPLLAPLNKITLSRLSYDSSSSSPEVISDVWGPVLRLKWASRCRYRIAFLARERWGCGSVCPRQRGTIDDHWFLLQDVDL